MKYLYFLIFIFTINVSAYDYEPIELSENKKDLSKEIYLKLEKGHFVKNKDKTNFNERYIKAVLKKLDKNFQNYLNETNEEVVKNQYSINDIRAVQYQTKNNLNNIGFTNLKIFLISGDSNNYLLTLIENIKHKPFLVSRLGIGQETVTTYNYLACGRFSRKNVLILAHNNGIYCDNEKDVESYCKFYANALSHSDGLALWEPPLVNDILIPQNYFCKKFENLYHLSVNILEIHKLLDKNIIPWTHSLLGKKILIINPFISSLISLFTKILSA